MLIAVYGVMSVVNLSANAAASYSPAPEKLTIEYKASNIPMSLWEYGYDIEDIVSSAKTSNKGTLGVYETTVDYDSYSLKDEIAIPEDGLVFDAKQYLNNSSDVIIITLRSSAFELNDYIYRTDDDAIESMSGICFGLSEDGSVVILASYFDSVPLIYPSGTENDTTLTFIDAPIFGLSTMKTVNNTAFVSESMEPELLSVNPMSADDVDDIVIDTMKSIDVSTMENNSETTYAFSNLVSGAVFEITYPDGTKVRTEPSSKYGMTSISLDPFIDIDAIQSGSDNTFKTPIEFTIQEVVAPSGCVLDDTIYTVSFDTNGDGGFSAFSVSPDNGTIHSDVYGTSDIYGTNLFFNNTGKEKEVNVEKVAKLNDANSNGIADSGETIDYTFFITNDGSDLIGDMRLEDPMLGLTGDDAITVKKDLPDDIFKPRPESVEPYDAVHYCPNMIGPDSVFQMQEALNEYMLFPGETVRIKSPVSYTVTDDDVEAGIVTNEATFVGQTVLRFTGDENVIEVLNEETTAEGDADTPTKASQPGTQPSSSMTIVKEADKDAMSDVKPGDTITYSFTITNTGNTTLSDIDVVDDMIEKDGAEIDTSSVDSLAAGESATLTADYAVTDDDIAAGIVTNVATATATDDSGNKVGTVESKAVTTIERPSNEAADKKPAENENASAEETLTDVSDEDEASNDIVDIVQTGVTNHSAQTIVAIVASAIIAAVIAYRKIMK